VEAYAKRAIEALADETRQAIFEALAARPRSVTELAETLPVTRPAVSQHLRILERARLVIARAEGRRRLYSLDPHGIAAARDYLDGFWPIALAAYTRTVAAETRRPATPVLGTHRNPVRRPPPTP
jgi:DNA-binding transcriptional ArsR family regulator